MAPDQDFFARLQHVRRVVNDASMSIEQKLVNLKMCRDDGALRRELFGLLDSPDWIAPLLRDGWFDHPPTLERVQGGGVRYPNWPEGKYLVRMASHAAEYIASIMSSVHTDNWSVAHDVLDAAKRLPPEYGVKLVNRIAGFVETNVLWHDLNDVAEVALHLLRGGQHEASMELVRRCFTMEWNREHGCNRRDEYSYISSLDKDIVPVFAPILPQELIGHLFYELRSACQIRNSEHRRSGDDYSYVWRPAIEDHEQNRDYEIDGQLVGCVRRAIELALSADVLNTREVLEILNAEQWLVFKRLRLHVLRTYPDMVEVEIREAIMDRESLFSPKCQHEYGLLVHDHFDKLTPEMRETWLAWVDEGPKRVGQKDDHMEKESQQAKEWQQYLKLVWVKDHLAGDRAELVRRLSESDKKPELAFFPWYMRVGRPETGSSGPYTAEALQAMGFVQAVEAVSNWRPPEDADPIDGPTLGNVRDVFQEFCGADSVAYSKQAKALIGRPGEYVRSFLTAMNRAYKEHKAIDISAILSLCAWVLSRDIEEDTLPVTTGHDLVDSSWRWTWNTIAELIQNLCDSGAPLDHRDKLWQIITKLADAPVNQKSEERFKGEDPRTVDFVNYAMNSTQGEAMRAVMAYAHWVGKSLTQDDNDSVPGGFDMMPEVRVLLQRKLDPADQGGFAVRAVYGWRFGLLFWIDRDWLCENTIKIFSLREIEDTPGNALGWAAWNSFLFANRPHKEFYDILRDQYGYAVDQLKDIKDEKDYQEGKPFHRLGEHLMVLYWRGGLDLETDNGILARLLTQSPITVRNNAIMFIGRSLHQTEGDIPPDILERLQSLWEWYWANVGKKDASSTPESSVFGWWFGSGKFPPEWSLPNMMKFAQTVPCPDPDHIIAEQLAKHAEAYPKECVTIVTSMINGDNEGWRTHSIQSSAREILTHGMRAGGEAKQLAEKAIDTLGRRGYVEFGELLQM